MSRSRERLKALQTWTRDTVCKGRIMKAPGKSITDIERQEPDVYLGFYPTRPDETGKKFCVDQFSTVPGVLIIPMPSQLKNVEDRRFDTYNHIHRSQEYGQWLNVSILFAVYEPGIRLPLFKESGGSDMSKFKEGTEEGLLTLMDWMDDFCESLLAAKTIPGTDLTLDEASAEYGPYAGTDFDVDKRPIFYGIVNVKFQCYANQKEAKTIDPYLD